MLILFLQDEIGIGYKSLIPFHLDFLQCVDYSL